MTQIKLFNLIQYDIDFGEETEKKLCKSEKKNEGMKERR